MSTRLVPNDSDNFSCGIVNDLPSIAKVSSFITRQRLSSPESSFKSKRFEHFLTDSDSYFNGDSESVTSRVSLFSRQSESRNSTVSKASSRYSTMTDAQLEDLTVATIKKSIRHSFTRGNQRNSNKYHLSKYYLSQILTLGHYIHAPGSKLEKNPRVGTAILSRYGTSSSKLYSLDESFIKPNQIDLKQNSRPTFHYGLCLFKNYSSI